MTVTIEDLRRTILENIIRTLSVEKTYDEDGHKFRHERFSITFEIPEVLNLGSYGFKGYTADIDAEILTERKFRCPRCGSDLWYWSLTGFYICFNTPCEYWIHIKDVERGLMKT